MMHNVSYVITNVIHVQLCFLFFCFFKQKTAYEMRISDWSSDVCSSDLHHRHVTRRAQGRHEAAPRFRRDRASAGLAERAGRLCIKSRSGGRAHTLRSEEHTSELQSLMRISYAVFCLKKKKQTMYNIDLQTIYKNNQ